MKLKNRSLFQISIMSHLHGWLIIIMLSTAAIANAQFNSLNIYFTNVTTGNDYTTNDLYITIFRGQTSTLSVTDPLNVPAITYGDGSAVLNWAWDTNTNYISAGVTSTVSGAIYSASVSLSDIGNHGGYIKFISNAESSGLLVSYGSPLPVSNGITSMPWYSTAAISPANSSDPSYNSIYQPIEISYGPQSGDQSDSTAINWFSSQLGISVYTNTTASGTPIQSKGYFASTPAFVSYLTNALGANASNTIITSTTNSAQVTRILGPTSFSATTFGSYTNFNDYLGYMQTQNNTTNALVISNTSSFLTAPATTGNPYSNAAVTFVMTNTITGSSIITNSSGITNGYTLTVNGNVNVTYRGYDAAHTLIYSNTITYTNVTFFTGPNYTNSLQTAGANAVPSLIYSGSPTQNPNNSAFSGTGTNSWSKFLTDIAPYNQNAPPVTTTQNQIAGELAASFAFGEAGSTNIVTIGTNTGALGSFASGSWWSMTNPIAFDQAQTNSGFYDIYAGAIYKYTSNSVYGSAYSDRYSYLTPLVQSYELASSNSTNYIGSMLISIGDPIGTTAVPEPATPFLLGLGSLAGVVALVRSRRRS